MALFSILACSVACSGGEDLCKALAATVQACGLTYVSGQGDGGFSDGILRVAEMTEASCSAGISSCTADEQTSLRRYSDCSLSGTRCGACTYQSPSGDIFAANLMTHLSFDGGGREPRSRCSCPFLSLRGRGRAGLKIPFGP